MRKIAIVTGTRAEFWLFRPLMKKIQERRKEMQLQIFATGMHLSATFGSTVRDIENEFEITDTVDINIKEKNTMQDMADSLASGISGFVRVLAKNKPDIIVLLGDRIEQLAAAIAANFLRISIAHLHGGELSGNIDNPIRQVNTRLAHIHFPATKKSALRIIKMGEEKWRIHVVGAPGVEAAKQFNLLSKEELCKKYSLNFKPIITVLYHPETINWQNAKEPMDMILNTTTEFVSKNNMQLFVIYPNADAGGYAILESIKLYESSGKLKSAVTIPQIDYFSLLSHSSLLIGNTSSGIIEAPIFKLPFINIGSRQDGREQASNVINIPILEGPILKSAMHKALYDKYFIKRVKNGKNPYDGGETSDFIVDVLANLKIDSKLLDKKY